MSTYIAATELSVILPAPVSITGTSSPLNLGEVATICFEIGAEIDSAVAGAGYAVPVSPSYVTAYAQVQSLNKMGAAGRVLGILAPNVAAAGGKMTLASEYRMAYDAELKRIREGKTPLVGAPSDTGTDARELPRSFETSNVGNDLGGASPILSTRYVW